MATTLCPLYDKVLVRPEEPKSQTKNGIFLPGNASDKRQPKIGEVMAVGPGHIDTSLGKNAPLIPLRVEVGQRVLFGAYAGTEVDLDGVKHLIIPEQEILSVVCDTGA